MTKDTEYKIKVMQASLDIQDIQFRERGDIFWSTCHHPWWDWANYDYRIKPKVPDSIDANAIDPMWKFMARDYSGEVFLYERKPERTSVGFSIHGRYTSIVHCGYSLFTSYRRGTVDWKDSLVDLDELRGIKK